MSQIKCVLVLNFKIIILKTIVTMRLKLLFSALFLGLFVFANAQKTLPRIFVLGEDEKAYQALVEKYPQTLLAASDNEIVGAFEKWVDFLTELEAYSDKIKYDLNGVKAWLHVFWNADGSIKHIGYLLQPDSKNVDKAEFRAILSSFLPRHQMELETDQPFAHYSIASFPVMNQQYSSEK